jgi:hypothetical protein
MNASSARSLVAATLGAAALAAGTAPSAQSTHDVAIVLERVGERLEQYYKRVQNIICTEKVTAQDVGSDLSPRGFARVVESELRVESDSTEDASLPNGARVVRSIRKVNGRAPRPKDKEACYDPNPLSEEPLAFLLPAKREQYAFVWAGFGKERDRNAMLVDFRPRESGKPEVKEHERNREGCLSFSMPGGTRGRLWIDAETHDVLRVEERLVGPVDFIVPVALQRRHNFPDATVLDRFDRYVRYKAVKFDDPPETMLLPEFIDELTIWRGGGSHRIRQAFSEYKRFLTAGRIVK